MPTQQNLWLPCLEKGAVWAVRPEVFKKDQFKFWMYGRESKFAGAIRLIDSLIILLS